MCEMAASLSDLALQAYLLENETEVSVQRDKALRDNVVQGASWQNYPRLVQEAQRDGVEDEKVSLPVIEPRAEEF